MDMGLKDKVAVVCAASKGLGKASAMGLAAEGAHLVICARGEDVLKQTADEIAQKTGVKVVTVGADLSKEEDCNRLIETAQREFGGLDILVNNAGGPPPGFFMDFSDAQWEAGFQQNFMSAVRLIRLAIPIMKERGGGRVINIVSLSVKQPIENIIISNSIRAGVIGLTKTLSQQFGNGRHHLQQCPARHDPHRPRAPDERHPGGARGHQHRRSAGARRQERADGPHRPARRPRQLRRLPRLRARAVADGHEHADRRRRV